MRSGTVSAPQVHDLVTVSRTMRLLLRFFAAALALAALGLPAVAFGHELFDHPFTGFGSGSAPPGPLYEGGEGATWEFVDSILTGNPHTDLDFFTRGGETFASVGTLGGATNGGGQTIVQLTTNGGKDVDPSLVSQHPSASCVTNEAEALGLQHDVEAAPKGNAILNTTNPFADTRDTQVIVDATDAAGRCHDSMFAGTSVPDAGVNDKFGGLEIIDVTDPAKPFEIGLTRHVGEAHTVNIDPKRPHIAYVSSSDSVSLDAQGRPRNEDSENDLAGLDGIEVVDF